jgi:hypothetical protein
MKHVLVKIVSDTKSLRLHFSFSNGETRIGQRHAGALWPQVGLRKNWMDPKLCMIHRKSKLTMNLLLTTEVLAKASCQLDHLIVSRQLDAPRKETLKHKSRTPDQQT